MLKKFPIRRFQFSHTAELHHEYYLTKYESILKDAYKLEYSRTKGFATKEGTLSYGDSYHFRQNYRNELSLSSIGIGSYLGAPDQRDDIKLFGAIVDSVRSGGVNVIDTAINYRYMKSERVIGAALQYLKYPREQLFISSKNGYIPGDGDRGIQEQQLITDLLNRNIISQEDVVGDCHCMHPKYLEAQLESSLSHLGLETLDLMYLHNAAEAQLPILGYEKFYDKLKKVFEFYELQVQKGKIRRYGLATFVCFRAREDEDRLHLNLEKVIQLAEEVAGKNHHLEYIQLPINIAMPESFAESWQTVAGEKTQFLSAARLLNINVVGSSPLMGGTMMQVPLPSEIFKCQNLGAKHLQFLRSIPAEALKTIVVGQKANRHVKMNLEVIDHKPLTVDEFWDFLLPKKRTQQPEDELDVQ